MSETIEQYRTRLREALAVIERLRARIAMSERAASEPLAIVGVGCRFPGGGDGPDAYWDALARGVDAVRDIPEDRWPAAAIPGDRSDVRRAALLDRVDAFDAAFFGISPREADSLDPQQRLLLEVVWESLEDAGLAVESLVGGAVGVFVGLNSQDYQHRLVLRGPGQVDAYSATGNLLSTASGRISYVFGFQGPCIALDTACSSSLVAVALACQSLRAGECEVALAGGVTLLLSPYMMALAAGTSALAPDGRCKTFDARANGFVRGEGCGVVAIKRLSDAVRDGDRVRAVIRGWAVNQDGRSSGLTAPNVLSQQALLRRALAQARVAPDQVGYVEMHGTGTPLGDPIEAEALREVLGAPHADGSRCVLGAVKTNLGHLEAAAGIAGLIKGVLALGRGQIPGNLHFRRLNPRISLAGTCFTVPTGMVAWPRGERRRVMGVSSFGIGGTNAHVILEEAPAVEGLAAEEVERGGELVTLSARDPTALTVLAGRVGELLDGEGAPGLADLAFSLATTRSPLEQRLAVVASSRAGLRAALAAVARGETPVGVVRGSAGRGKLAVLFTGQGAQTPGMGRGLYAAWPAFREVFDRCVDGFDAGLERPLRDVMWTAPGSELAGLLDRTVYAQASLFTLEVALAGLWRSWGVEPDVVAGHSVGELAAACVVGVMGLEDAVRVVAARGRLMQGLAAGGAMVSIAASGAEVAAEIAGGGAADAVVIAAENGPRQVVISGDEAAVRAVAELFARRGVRTRGLQVSHAFHSPRMEPMLAEFRRVVAGVHLRAPDRPLAANVTGALAGPEIATPEYWVRQVRDRVLFADGVRALHASGATTWLELGPRAALLGLVPACLPDGAASPGLVAALRAGQDESTSVLAALGGVWATGRRVRWSGVWPAGGRRVALPRYPWQRERFWIDAPGPGAGRGGAASGHPLLGVRVALAGALAVFEATFGLAGQRWLADHRVAGLVVVPGAVIAELVRAAGERGLGAAVRVVGLVLRAPLVVPETGSRRVQVVVSRGGQGVGVAVYSQAIEAPADGWSLHAEAMVEVGIGAAQAVDLAAIRGRCGQALDVAGLYARFAGLGIVYGPVFRGVRSLWRGDGEALAEVVVPDGFHGEGHGAAPPLLDAAFQAVLAAVPAAELDGLRMPFALDEFTLHRTGVEAAWVHVQLVKGTDWVADVRLVDAAGDLVAEVTGLRMQAADPAALGGAEAAAQVEEFFAIEWREVAAPERATARVDGVWIAVAAAGSELADALVAGPGRWLRTDVAGLARVLAAEPSVAGVVCVWESGAGEADAAAQRITDEAVAVVQALVGATIRLWWISVGAVAVVAGEAVAIAAAPVWGLGRCVMQEHPELGCTLVDVDGAGDGAAAVLRELAGEDGEDQVAWRGGVRRVARLVRARVDAGAVAGVLARATVLVTGGLGALGLHVARGLARGGAAHLLLTGRRGLATPGAAEAVASLESLGARVTVAAVDVADRAALAAVLRAVPDELPLGGVVHAAGAVEDGVLVGLTTASVARVFAPKVAGAWNLHVLTAGMELGFFVLFSSLAGVLGSAGQGNYAAASSFLDALAGHRRACGRVGTSVAWGAWSAGGMAGVEVASRLARLGMGTLTPERGVALFERALGWSGATLAVGTIDVRAVGRALGGAVPPVWRALIAGGPAAAAPGAWAARLTALPAGRRAAEVRAMVEAEVARVLAWTRVVPGDRPLQELGLDSLMAVELRGALGQRVGAALPVTLAFDFPTVDALVGWLLAKLQTEAPEPVAIEPAVAGEESIAIVGMACRLPGGVVDPDGLWRLLDAGGDAIAEVPRSRWDIDALYDPDPRTPGKMVTRSGGFLADIDRFDAGFFGISPREAAMIDPQQRLLLETSWEALESAGIAADRVMGTDAGVFVGLMYQEYASLVGGLTALDGHVSTGTSGSVASGRISYVLGLKGPSMTVDTACSSSLVTTHLACQALQRGECSLALAGGVALMLTPTVFVEFSRLRGLAADGRCKSFSAAADGVGWSEGCAVLVLKRLGDAQRDGDPVLAVIRGSAVNQDGRSNGLTAPNGPSQEAVIRQALARAGLPAAALDYVECHGTGTRLGDPIEVQALGAVMVGRAVDRPLRIGSVKSNLGHVQAAAGAAGIIKVVLALQHGRIPKNLHFEAPSPLIAWDSLPVRVVAEAVEWPRGAAPRRAGVSSFGVSGTNAHVILEEAPTERAAGASVAATERAERGMNAEEATSASLAEAERAAGASVAGAERATLVVVSARTEAALAAQAGRLREHLIGRPGLGVADVAASLARGRSAMQHRLALVVDSRAGLLAGLDAAARGSTPTAGARGRSDGERVRVVLVFPGQGGQWLGMGRRLLREQPVFRAGLWACDRAIAAETGWSVVAELMAEPDRSRLGQVDVVQPVLFAVEVGLAALWRAWGVVADAVIGHSMGEVAAAHVAGALTLEDAAAVICRRSRLLGRIGGRGEMALVELSVDAAAAALVGREARLSVAVSNSRRSTVIAGEPAALAEVLAELAGRGVFCRRVKVDVASHSPQVDGLLPELRAALVGLRPRAAALPMVSTVTGAVLAGPELGADYWVDNLRAPVQFGAAVETLVAGGSACFLEVSPHPVLTSAIDETIAAVGRGGAAIGSLRRDQDEHASLLAAAAGLWVRGAPLVWDAVVPGGRRVPLPTYAWQRARHWVSAAAAATVPRGHPLIGEGVAVSTLVGVRVWETRLDVARLAWLADHRVEGVVVMPGAGLLEMALAAGVEALGGAAAVVGEVVFAAPLTFVGAAAVQVQVVTTESAGALRFQIAGRTGEAWTVHAHGLLRRAEPAGAAGRLDVAEIRGRLGTPTPGDAVYAGLAARGLAYGPAFTGIEALWAGEGEALARVHAGAGGAYQVSPMALDACFQALAGAIGGDETWVPAEVGALTRRGVAVGELWCHVRMRDAAGGRRTADLRVVDADGWPVVEVSGLVVQALAAGGGRVRDEWFVGLTWELAAVPAAAVSAGRFVVIGDAAGLGAEIAAGLVRCGHAALHAGGEDAGVRALLADGFAGQAPTGVVHVRGLDVAGAGDGAEGLEAGLVCGYDSALRVTQALVGLGHRDPPRLWLVTRGAQAVGDGEVMALQGPLVGLGRVIAMEHPELRCTRVDLDPRGRAGEADAVVAELVADSAEQEVAVRDARWVARLVRRAPVVTRSVRVRAGGSYVITGGLGGLGLGVAGWLVERGAGQVVLVGRAGAASAAQQAAVAALCGRGTRVTVARADVAVREEVARVLAEVAGSGLPLAGVVHAAGSLDDGMIAGQDPGRLRGVIAAKGLGALHLDELTRGSALDLFVLYASASGLLGSPGQSNYAAANALLDGLAHRRRGRGLEALSVDWGAFSAVGLAAESAERGERLASRGLRSLEPGQGLVALERLLAGDVTQAAVVPLDVRQWVEFYPAAAAPMLSRLLADRPVGVGRGLAAQLAGASAAERVRLVVAMIRGEVVRVLRISDEGLDAGAPLTSLGMDSLMGLELRNRIEAALGVRLAATLLWTYSTVEALGEHLAGLVAPVEEVVEEVAVAAAEEGLADEQLFALLDETLARAGRRAEE